MLLTNYVNQSPLLSDDNDTDDGEICRPFWLRLSSEVLGTPEEKDTLDDKYNAWIYSIHQSYHIETFHASTGGSFKGVIMPKI